MKYWFHKPVQKPGWRDTLPLYKIRCDRHGISWEYPHGYAQRIGCPICAEEKMKNVPKCPSQAPR